MKNRIFSLKNDVLIISFWGNYIKSPFHRLRIAIVYQNLSKYIRKNTSLFNMRSSSILAPKTILILRLWNNVISCSRSFFDEKICEKSDFSSGNLLACWAGWLAGRVQGQVSLVVSIIRSWIMRSCSCLGCRSLLVGLRSKGALPRTPGNKLPQKIHVNLMASRFEAAMGRGSVCPRGSRAAVEKSYGGV